MLLKGGDKYKGETVDGVPHGSGILLFKDNQRTYIGEFLKGKREGKG